MHVTPAEEVGRRLDYPGLIEDLRAMFRDGCEVPVRQYPTVAVNGGPAATLLLMPAWQTCRHIGVKVATVFPGNGAKGLPGVMASYLLLDDETGAPVALLDGAIPTARRTACASAPAADYLARLDAAHLLMVCTALEDLAAARLAVERGPP